MRSEHKGLAMTQALGPLQATSRSENLQLMKKIQPCFPLHHHLGKISRATESE